MDDLTQRAWVFLNYPRELKVHHLFLLVLSVWYYSSPMAIKMEIFNFLPPETFVLLELVLVYLSQMVSLNSVCCQQKGGFWRFTSVLWWFKQESWKMPEQNLLEVVPYRLWSTLPAFLLAGGDRPLRVGAHLYHVRLQCGGEKNIWKQERSHELCF